jgi:hypothetical protein
MARLTEIHVSPHAPAPVSVHTTFITYSGGGGGRHEPQLTSTIVFILDMNDKNRNGYVEGRKNVHENSLIQEKKGL